MRPFWKSRMGKLFIFVVFVAPLLALVVYFAPLKLEKRDVRQAQATKVEKVVQYEQETMADCVVKMTQGAQPGESHEVRKCVTLTRARPVPETLHAQELR